MEGKKEVSSLGSRSRLQLTDTQEVEFSVHADSVQVSTFQKKLGHITILGEVQQKQDKSMITLHIFCNNHKFRWKRWRAGWPLLPLPRSPTRGRRKRGCASVTSAAAARTR